MNIPVILAANSKNFWEMVVYLVQVGGKDFLQGAGNTILLAVVGTAIGCLIGFLVGIVQTIPIQPQDPLIKKILLKIVRIFMSVYIEVFRGTPMIIQAVVIYYGSLAAFGIDMKAMLAGFVIISINTGAYMSESVRGGIDSIDIGQTEAAKAIGMTHFQTMFSIVFPQALRNILPQIGNNLIINIKDSSVLMIISVTELFYTTRTLAGTYYVTYEPYLITCVIYLAMTFTCSRLLRWYEKKIDGPDSYNLASTDATGAAAQKKRPTGVTMQMINRKYNEQRSAMR
ncbi:MAG: amino acid ABC transporter permease [Eubacteriales bacterium]